MAPFSASPRASLRIVAAVAIAGGFLFGYDTAVINGANQYLTAHFRLDAVEEGLAGASAILGCIPGAMIAGFLSDRFGRRKLLYACAILYAASGLLSALAATFPEFLAARFISGLGIGASSMICPVYIAEMAPASARGRLGSLFQLGIVTGIFLTLFANAGIQRAGNEIWNTTVGWRWMLGAEVLPALVLLLLVARAPESTRWLATRETGRSAAEEGRLGELFGPRFRRPLVIAVALMALSQFSGINAIMYYSTRIFTSAGTGMKDAFGASVLVGLVNFLFTFVAIALVDRGGRRALLTAGLALQTVALAAVGLMFRGHHPGLPLTIAVLAFIAAFAMALGPIPWILCSEIFPTRLRGRAMSLATFVIWSACYLVAQTFPMLNDSPAIGPAGTFGIYAGCSLLGLIFVLALVPETKGRSLEEIEAGWKAGASRGDVT